jgi:hypothetical protein
MESRRELNLENRTNPIRGTMKPMTRPRFAADGSSGPLSPLHPGRPSFAASLRCLKRGEDPASEPRRGGPSSRGEGRSRFSPSLCAPGHSTRPSRSYVPITSFCKSRSTRNSPQSAPRILRAPEVRFPPKRFRNACSRSKTEFTNAAVPSTEPSQKYRTR